MQTKIKILLTLTFMYSLTTPIYSDESLYTNQPPIQEKPVITKLLFINKTQRRIQAVFEPVTACMEPDPMNIEHFLCYAKLRNFLNLFQLLFQKIPMLLHISSIATVYMPYQSTLQKILDLSR